MPKAGWTSADRGYRYIYHNAADEVRAMVSLIKGDWCGRLATAGGWGEPHGPFDRSWEATAHMDRMMAQMPPTPREREVMALMLASPARSTAPQADAAHLPLFVAANEPRLL